MGGGPIKTGASEELRPLIYLFYSVQFTPLCQNIDLAPV